MKKFAVLYPKDAYGKEYFNLFWNEVKNQGGEITSVQSYEPKETDFNTSIKKLVGTFYVNDRKKEYNKLLAEWKLKNKNSRKHPPADLLPPVVDFDALFIPDNSRAVGQIAPMLAYNNVKDVVLIGTNLWNTSSLVRRGQRYVEKALFVDFISSKEKEFINSNFYKIFYKQFDRTPTHFEAQGYDTGLLILKVLRQDINRRDGFRDSLAEIENFHGVTGIITSVNREFHPPLTLYTVEKGKIVAQ
jgi:ABC-type branched-subunit amino acid transport system substrate-binding protein